MASQRRYLIEQMEPRLLLANLVIPVTAPRDVVFDPVRHLLYITTDGGRVERFDLDSKKLLSSIQVGVSLNGADVTPNGNALYIADDEINAATHTGFVRKLDLNSGAVTSIPYALSGSEGSSWDVATTSNGKVLVTPSYYANFVSSPFLEIDTATDAPSRRNNGGSSSGMMLTRSADHSHVAVNLPSFGMGTYSATTDSFGPGGGRGLTAPSVSRDGKLYAVNMRGNGLAIVNENLHAIRSLIMPYAATTVFDPTTDMLYVGTGGTTLTAYSTVNWQPLFSFDTGSDIPGWSTDNFGPVAISNDGSQIAMVGYDKVTLVNVPSTVPDGVPAQIEISELPSILTYEKPAGFRVTIRDRTGAVCTNYAGTIHFAADDVRATLPAAYTYSPADAGTKTFQITSRGVINSVSVVDEAIGLSDSHQVSSKPLDPTTRLSIPLPRSFVYDSNRGLFYITRFDGLIDRYDPNTQTLLAPIVVGNPLRSIDISSDNAKLVVTDDYRSVNEGLIHEIDLNTGAITARTYPIPDPELSGSSLEAGSYDVAITSANLALFDSDFDGSGGSPLRQLDLSTGVVTGRGDMWSVDMKSEIVRSADRKTIAISETNSVYNHAVSIYDTLSNTFIVKEKNVGDDLITAVSPNGQLLLGSMYDYDRNLNVISANIHGGVFDPVRPIIYSRDQTSVTAYSTTGAMLWSAPIGETVSIDGGIGGIAISDDGRWLILGVNNGVRMFPLITRPVITSPPPNVSPGTNTTVIVTAQKPGGTADATYSGKVRITCTDPVAVLPSDYTFSAADSGLHTFGVRFSTPGRHTLTVTDVGTGLSVAQYDVLVAGAALGADGALYAIGGAAVNDTLTLSGHDGVVDVTLNGVKTTYLRSQIQRVDVLLQGGNDSLTVSLDGVPGGMADLGAGNDTVTAVSGDDRYRSLVVNGGNGGDGGTLMASGVQKLVFSGDAGADGITFIGSAGPDVLTASGGWITGTRSADLVAEVIQISGGAGDDTIGGGWFDPPTLYTINGGDGNDSIAVTSGGTRDNPAVRMTVLGGNGDDSLEVLAQHNFTNYWTFDGNAGTDILTLRLNGSHGASLASTFVSTNYYTHANYTGIEQLIGAGSEYGDSFTVFVGTTGPAVRIDAAGGNDVITLATSPSTKTVSINGQAGNDGLVVSATTTAGTFNFDGGDDTDTISFSTVGGSVNVLAERVSDVSRQVFDQRVESIVLTGSIYSDTFNITPRLGSDITLSAAGPTPPELPGDSLVIVPAGITDLALAMSAPGAGVVTASNRRAVSFSEIESITDVFAPRVSNAAVAFDTSPMSVAINFTEDVGASLAAGDAVLRNTISGEVINPSGLQLDYAANVATFKFAIGLPDGNYRLELAAGNVADPAGNPLASTFNFDFFVLSGDANHDRKIDANDLAILSANWQGTSKTFSQGDFNYDGKVDIQDLYTLSSKWQQSLPPPAPAAAPVATTLPRRTPVRVATSVLT